MSGSQFHPTGVHFDPGVHFDHGYHPAGLVHILEFVRENQDCFVLPPNHGRQGLLQIPTPTESAAAAWVSEASDRVIATLAGPALA
jgi:hypothetical protein